MSKKINLLNNNSNRDWPDQKMYTPPVSVPSRNIPARPDEDFDLLLGELLFRVHGRTPNSYLLFWDEHRHQEICAVATKYDDEKKPSLWAVRRGNSCMGKTDGVFIYEPQPSSRDDEFFTEYRFATFEEAERVYLSFHCR